MPFPYILPIDLVTDNQLGADIETVLASALRRSEHIVAFDKLAGQMFDDLDLTPLLIYMIDTVPASALPYLAAQFDILGYKGWRFANTEAEQRELLKKAIELHRFKGTPWSIKEAIRRAGYGGAEIIEGVGRFLDGTWLLNGTVTLNGLGNWACFRVVFDLGNEKGIDAQESADVQELVKEYKNARSRLVDISYEKNLDETVTIGEELLIQMELADLTVFFSGRNLDGTWLLNGSVLPNAYAEDISIIEQ
jgi:phage tail P2-like protein